MIQLIPPEEQVLMGIWIPITKAYKYEMEPTRNQEVKMNQTLSICRHLYNDSLAERKEGWENGEWNVDYYDQATYLPDLKNKNKDLCEVQSQVLQNVIKRVEIAYQNFFRRVNNNKEGKNAYKKPGFPRFKGYGRYNSFTFPQSGNGCDIKSIKGDIKCKNEKRDIIRLSKIGEIKFIKHREIGENENGDLGIPYLIKIVTIKKEIDKWFVIFTVDTFVEIEVPIVKKQYTNIEDLNSKSAGIDMGLSNLATLSNGKKIEPPEYLRESEKILAKHQRRLSRKQRNEIEIVDQRETKKQKKEIKKKIKVNSKNREKERINVAKVHKKITNQRRNFNHEVSRILVDNFDLIAFEKLNIQGMVQNHRLAKSISDASWYQLQMFTSYKAEWAGKIVEFVDPKSTSQECSRCGHKEHLELKDRIFKCSKCGLEIDRDMNASINIRNRSIEYQNRLKIFTPGTGGGACLSSLNRDTMIQEAPAFRRE